MVNFELGNYKKVKIKIFISSLYGNEIFPSRYYN